VPTLISSTSDSVLLSSKGIHYLLRPQKM